MNYVKLSNGVLMPRIGLGTWKLKGSTCENSILHALSFGYELIDSAAVYGNESIIGEIIKRFEPLHNPPRLETASQKGIFITSKAAPNDMGYEKTYQACLKTLENLKMPCIDLYLLHWPGSSKKSPTSEENSNLRIEAWKAMERLYEEKKVRAIGVSNFLTHHIKDLMNKGGKIMPQVNQIEIHPLCPNIELREYAKKNNVVLQAYSSLGSGVILKEKKLEEYLKNKQITPAQILLKWGLDNDLCIIPKSTNKIHIKENIDVLTFPKLETVVLDYLNNLATDDTAKHICWDPRSVF